METKESRYLRVWTTTLHISKKSELVTLKKYYKLCLCYIQVEKDSSLLCLTVASATRGRGKMKFSLKKMLDSVYMWAFNKVYRRDVLEAKTKINKSSRNKSNWAPRNVPWIGKGGGTGSKTSGHSWVTQLLSGAMLEILFSCPGCPPAIPPD